MEQPMKSFASRFGALAAALSLALPAQADIVVKDDIGQEIRLKEPAKRIVSLAPHATESLFAAGAGGKVVAAVDYSDYPEAARKLPRVGGYSRIDLEAVAALKPDVVVAWQSGNPTAQVDKLKALGLNVFTTQPNQIDDIPGLLERFGQLAGTEPAAKAAAQTFRNRLAALRQANLGKPPVRVFYQVWKSPLTTVGGPQIISSAIKLCGGENVFGNLKQMAPNVSMEAVLEMDPEVIVATGMGDAAPEWLADWKKWPKMAAVKRENLFHINPDIMQRHTPRILDGTEKLCANLDLARSRRAK
jgi:iron complex transport system substrate-binding protein